MKNKSILAIMIVLLLTLHSPLTHMCVEATEENASDDRKTEYVVRVDNEQEFEELAEEKEAAVVEDESVEELEEENMVVLELTAEEATELEDDKNIIVEENIRFAANTMESSDVKEEDSAVTEESTEMTSEIPEDIAASETVTEEDTEDSASTETVTEATDEAAEPAKEKKAKTSKKEDTEKNKKEKENEKDKSSKEKKDKEELAAKRAKIESKKNRRCEKVDQWNLDAIRYTDSITDKDTIKVALLDSGVSFDDDIPIVERITINENNEVNNALFDDATGHGTSMAGVIVAQDNGEGMKGINPNAEIYSIQILDENNQSTLGQVIAGIHKAIELDCDIINMSFGATVDSQLLHDAIKEADKNGILMIAAAGNTEGGAVEYPAAYDEVLAVGATDTTGNKLAGSSDGTEIEIFAPGDQVVSSGLFGGNVVLSGTSIAAAQVTGAASVLWSMDKEKPAGFIRSLMINTTQVMDDNGMSEAGLLDIENAVAHHGELEYTYEEDSYEYEELQEDAREAEAFLDVKLVNGMWSRAKHEDMATSAANSCGVDNANVVLMAKAANAADDYKDADNLHASGNYVKTLKFLYQCAWYLRKGYDTATSITMANSETDILKTAYGPNLVSAIESLLAEDANKNKSVRYYKVLGFAMHLTGDVYAHRTIVPAYTVKGTNSAKPIYSTSNTSMNARFGTNAFANPSKAKDAHTVSELKNMAKKSGTTVVCKNWKCFQKTINLGVMEFRDIKNFANNNGRASVYEDNVKFCTERYEDAKICCEELFYYFDDKNEFDGICILFPTEDNVKLNNFKVYSQKAGEDVSAHTAAEWNIWSTPEEY